MATEPPPMSGLGALLEGVSLDVTTKGVPSLGEPVPLLSVAGLGWTLDDLQPPVLLLRRSALEHNLSVMADYCRLMNVGIAPHGKTTMAPQLWRMQLEAGAWGITAATAVQARIMRAAGVRRILIANEVTDAASIRWLVDDLANPADQLLCYVDSEAGLRLLEDGLRTAERPLRVLVELGHAGGRTGNRDPASAEQLARAVSSSPALELAGVAGYEGTIAHDREPAHLDRVREFLDALHALVSRLAEGGLVGPEPIVTAGGSLYFDLVAERLGAGWQSPITPTVLLRSGCYLTHDAGTYERSSPFADAEPGRRFRSAIEAWGAVLSLPEAGLALVGLGRRDVPFDQGLPRPLELRRPEGEEEDVDGRIEVTELNDQHSFCRLAGDVRVDVGDLLRFGISHPCTAFDRWRVIPVLDDADRVVDAVATFF